MRPRREIYYRIKALEKLGRIICKPVLVKELFILALFYILSGWALINLATDIPAVLFLLAWPLAMLFPIHFKLYRPTWELAGDYFSKAGELKRVYENLESGTGEFELRYELKKAREKENLKRAHALEWVLSDREAY